MEAAPEKETPDQSQPMTDRNEEDRIAIRDLLVWFGGSLLGGMGGFQLGGLLEANLIRLAAGVVGWLGGGLLGILLLSRIGRAGRFRTGPTIPVRTASWMVIGFLIGCLLGGLIGSIVLDQLADPNGVRPWSEGGTTLIGGVLGFVLGGLLAPKISRRPAPSGSLPPETPSTTPPSTSD